MVWLPRTAVGEGAEPGGDGEAEAAGLLDGVADVDGDPDWAAEAEGDVVTVGGEDGVVADGDVLCVTVDDGAVELASGLGLA